MRGEELLSSLPIASMMAGLGTSRSCRMLAKRPATRQRRGLHTTWPRIHIVDYHGYMRVVPCSQIGRKEDHCGPAVVMVCDQHGAVVSLG